MSADRAELPQPSIRMRLPAHSGAASGFSCRQSPYLRHKDGIYDCAASVPAAQPQMHMHLCQWLQGANVACIARPCMAFGTSRTIRDAEAHCLCGCTAAPLKWLIAASLEESLPEGAGPEVAQIIWNETLSAHDDANATQWRSCISMRLPCWAACPLQVPDSFPISSALQRELAV